MGVDFLMNQFIQKSNYETTYFDGEWIILNTDNYTLTKLNETGGVCWSLLSELQSVETLSDAIFKQFNSQCEGIQEDIKSFLDELLEYGLIKTLV